VQVSGFTRRRQAAKTDKRAKGPSRRTRRADLKRPSSCLRGFAPSREPKQPTAPFVLSGFIVRLHDAKPPQDWRVGIGGEAAVRKGRDWLLAAVGEVRIKVIRKLSP
jgi:hypothetical protein